MKEYQEMYNRVCQVWLAESARLSDKVKQAEHNLWRNGLTAEKAIEYFKLQAVQKYFDDYMMRVLDYLKTLT